jgi:hypothetical protein
VGGMAMGEFKIDKKSLALVKETTNILKEDMEDYHYMMFTHAMEFFQERANSITFFHNFIAGFVNRGFGFPWQPPINRIYET